MRERERLGKFCTGIGSLVEPVASLSGQWRNRTRKGRTLGAAHYVLCVIGLGVASGCSLFSIDSVAPPFPENPGYGQIVREIRVEGDGYTQTWIVLDAMKSKVGEPYTEETARVDFLWLSQLGTFTSVSFSTEPADDGIVLVVSVQEVSPYIPSLSFALTQENGVEIGPAFSSPNLFGWAARASIFARFGGATNFGIRYRDPWLPGKNWLVGYQAEYMHRERFNVLDDFNERSDEVTLQLRRNPLNSLSELHAGVRFQYLALRSDEPDKTLSGTGTDKIPALALFVEFDGRNGAYPTDGWFAETEVAKSGIFGGDGDYWQWSLDVRRYQPLPFGSRHSTALYSLLTLTSGEVGTDIPIYMDFHIGGTNSVRGWPLGSRVGKNQWLNTAEYWFRLLDDHAFRFWFIKWRMGLQLAAFGDVGTAWDTGPEFGDNFIGGFGGGLRMTIPVIVLVRIDLAYASNRFGIQFAIGGAEKALAQRQRVR